MQISGYQVKEPSDKEKKILFTASLVLRISASLISNLAI
jgi:hypothetical protein